MFGCSGIATAVPGAFQLDTLKTVSLGVHIPGMQIGLRYFGAASIDWLSLAVREDGRTRHALAREPWERENWRNAQGVPCLAQAREALLQLTDKLGPSLPAARPMPAMPDPVESDCPDLVLICGLADLGAVTLEPVGDADNAPWWQLGSGTRGAAVGGLQPCRPRPAWYRAAGWKCCAARTSGRPPGRRAVAPRAVWVEPLAAGWRAALCREPDRRLGATPTPHLREDADWADIEYRRGAHPDGRLRDRVVEMGRAWEHAPGASLPVIFPGAAEQKAAYRLLSNDRITMEHILEPHQEATVDRCRLEPVVLAIQDTTTLNYNGHQKTGGLVNLGGGGSGSRGLLARVGLAVTEGRPPARGVRTQRDAARRHVDGRPCGQRAGKRALAARP